MAEKFHLLGDDAIKQLRMVVRAEIARQKNTQPTYALPGNYKPIVKEGELIENLDPSTNNGITETTAKLKLWAGEGDQWQTTGEFIDVVNRSDGFSADEGSHLYVAHISGEWRPVSVSGSGGIVVGALTSDLAAATDALTDPGTATMEIYEREEPQPDPNDPDPANPTLPLVKSSNRIASGNIITVVNRFLNVSGNTGDIALASYIGFEWVLVGLDC